MTLREFLESTENFLFLGAFGKDRYRPADVLGMYKRDAPTQLERNVMLIRSGKRTFVHHQDEHKNIGTIYVRMED